MKKLLLGLLFFCIAFNMDAQVGDKYKPIWVTVTEADSAIIDYKKGKFQQISLTRNIALKFINVPDGAELRLVITHLVAGTIITNMPGNLPWDFYYASGTAEITQLYGTYSTSRSVWNWQFNIYAAGAFGIVSTHMMVAFTDLSIPGQVIWLTKLKSTGLNHIWAHMDLYDSVGGTSYRARLKRLMDSAYIVGGLPVSPGMSGPMTAKEMKQVVMDTYLHPNIFKIGGKPVYAIYDFDSTKLCKMVDSLTNNGIIRSSYKIIVSTFGYPQYQYWLSPPRWVNHVGTPDDSASVAEVYVLNSNVDGLINWSGDKATSTDAVARDRNINENDWITKASRAFNKIAYAGFTFQYHNAAVNDWELGFSGLDSVVKAYTTDLPTDKRPLMTGGTTNDDYVEWSYDNFGINPDTLGLIFMPRLNQGFYFNTIAYPLLDHSGITKFLQPRLDAFKRGQQNINLTQWGVFALYALHSRTTTPSNVIPSYLVPYRYADSSFITQSTWNGTYAANTPTFISSGKLLNFNKIRMAAWCIDSAQLGINGVFSAKQGPGIRFWEQPQSLGTPVFKVKVNGVDIITVNGNQPITTSTWPGQFQYLIQQLYYFKMPRHERMAMVDDYINQALSEVNEYENSLQLN